MSDPSFDHEIHDYTPVNKYIEEQARIRRTRSIWAYTRSIALFLLALGIFLLLLAFAYRWINKPYPEETNHTINYVPAVPENIYPGESSQQPDVFPGSKSETDKEGIGGNEVIVDQSVTYFTTKTIGKYSVVTGFTYNSSEGMRSGNKHNSSYCYLNGSRRATYWFDKKKGTQDEQLQLLNLTENMAISQYKKYCTNSVK